jgi:hypothetical protein
MDGTKHENNLSHPAKLVKLVLVTIGLRLLGSPAARRLITAAIRWGGLADA